MAHKIYIIGAGPGSADLLTLRAAALLRAASVVLHDDLVPREILDLCPPSAEIVNVGKRCGRRGTSQEQINALMTWHATSAEAAPGAPERPIVRLKSGDPAMFGRLTEETNALRRAGIEFEIVPGVSAAFAAAASAGISLTDRNAASSLVVTTGHSVHGARMRLAGFDPRRTTVTVYMPGPDYKKTADELMEAGLASDTPCLLVSNAGRAYERRSFLLLRDLPFAGGVASPAVLILGEAARRTPASAGAVQDWPQHEGIALFEIPPAP